MPFDDYLVKPVEEAELLETVNRLLDIGDLDEKNQELSSKKITRNVLQIEKNPRELADHDQFHHLEARIEQLEAEIAAMESGSAGETG